MKSIDRSNGGASFIREAAGIVLSEKLRDDIFMAMSTDAAAALVKQSFICDAILPWTEYGRPELRSQTLPRYKKSGFNLVSLSLGSDKETSADVLSAIGRARQDIMASSDLYAVNSSADIEFARAHNKLGVMLNMQGSDYLEGDLNLVEVFYSLGIRQTLLVYNYANRVGGGCHENTDKGLTAYGRSLVKEMNRIGMIVDCSHTGYRTSLQAIECSTQPVMFTHSNPKALWSHDRNITDEQALACAERGGLVGVVGVGIFMGDDDASTQQMFRQIDYWAQLIGPQHVSMGSDYVYDHEEMQGYMKSIDSPPAGNYDNMTAFFQPEQIHELVACMLSAGYSDQDIKGILGENYLRVASRIWNAGINTKEPAKQQAGL